MSPTHLAEEHLALADWRRRVHAMYASLRSDDRPEPMRAVAFRSAKDRLFGDHPSSPVPEEERLSRTGTPSPSAFHAPEKGSAFRSAASAG
jgi:hypothetical protein